MATMKCMDYEERKEEKKKNWGSIPITTTFNKYNTLQNDRYDWNDWELMLKL